MVFEDKYTKPKIDYWSSFIFRKLTSVFYAYPEFVFMGKIIIGIFAAFLFFTIFRRIFGI